MATRLTVNLTDRAEEAMLSIAESEGVDLTDAVNRALSVWAELCRYRDAGGNLHVEMPDGSVIYIAIV